MSRLIVILTVIALLHVCKAQTKRDESKASVISDPDKYCAVEPYHDCCGENRICGLLFHYEGSWFDLLDSEDVSLCEERCLRHSKECHTKCRSMSIVKEAESNGNCKCVIDYSDDYIYEKCESECDSANDDCFSGCDANPKEAETDVLWDHACGGECKIRDCRPHSRISVHGKSLPGCPASGGPVKKPVESDDRPGFGVDFRPRRT